MGAARASSRADGEAQWQIGEQTVGQVGQQAVGQIGEQVGEQTVGEQTVGQIGGQIGEQTVGRQGTNVNAGVSIAGILGIVVVGPSTFLPVPTTSTSAMASTTMKTQDPTSGAPRTALAGDSVLRREELGEPG